MTALGEELLPGFEADEGPAVKRMGGRVYRTVYTLFRHPGRLTADYIVGRRRPYLKPVQVFLTISVLFFLFGHNYFRFTLGEYEQVPVFGETFDAVAVQRTAGHAQESGHGADGAAVRAGIPAPFPATSLR
ncbi:MAG TPA: DUF3667 domain-containing protein [Longimicrobiales bacterium]